MEQKVILIDSMEESQLTVNGLVRIAHKNATEKGWHDKERSPLEYHALFHSEVSEATEAVRLGIPPIDFMPPNKDGVSKPEGEAIELADVIIRIADYFGVKGWDLQEVLLKKIAYNETRSHRHGGKHF